jgi:cell division protein FtsL
VATFVFVVVVDHRTRLSIRRHEAMKAESDRLIAEWERQVEAMKEAARKRGEQ